VCSSTPLTLCCATSYSTRCSFLQSLQALLLRHGGLALSFFRHFVGRADATSTTAGGGGAGCVTGGRLQNTRVFRGAATIAGGGLSFARNRMDSSVDIGVQSRTVAILVVALHQQTPGIFVQGAFRKGNNQETSDHG